MEELLKYWPLFAATVGMVAWFARLEAKVLYRERDRRDRSSKDREMWNKIDSLQKSIGELLESVGRIEGRLMRNGK